ncbi:voltage-gated chloride channel [Coprinopsis cinerea okayama7|uniref:Chloride channel protein n=1 Tax=Coprinopsis cinerea (strain Okayama-7 / 130 / ATCC MYA-4618 / FGSC 9003) TaxID=240176 RepID=A8N774_COPC7|nr:voltage-gated chloride channel [Coprinopsis cinerea okayama7\|eukprot:XP_001830680.2 voltage-gated chloride channel [Coprinopsis cinerea okayama7\
MSLTDNRDAQQHIMDPEEDEELEQLRRYEDFTTIDWIQDAKRERAQRLQSARDVNTPRRGPRGEMTIPWFWAKVRKGADAVSSWFVVSLVGVCIGLNAAIISIMSEWFSDLKMGYCSDAWWLSQQFCCWEMEGEEVDGCDLWHTWSSITLIRWIVFVLFATLFAFVASHLVRSLAKYAAGSGISEIKCILAGFVMQGFLGSATFFIKSITLPLVIASGLSVGKEGPSVHVACCIGFLVAGFFRNFKRSESKMREVITAASAAGVAVAFGSPIGGVLFSIEEMSHTFSIKTMWRSFFCALIATFTLAAMNPFRTGKIVLFQVTYDRDWHFFEIIFFVILGIFGGLYGAFVVKFNLQVAAFRRKHLANHGVAEAVTLATITAMIGYFNRFLRLDMTSSMAILFRECEGGGNVFNLCQSEAQWRIANSLLLATIIRIGLVVITYGCKVPAGIFVPSMAIGATFGRMVGIMVKAMYNAYPTSGIFKVCDPDVPCITPGTYAFLGAAAALSGVMRITVTVVVIMFELTGALTYILPTMIVLLVTKAVGDFLGTNGIADEMIRFNGFPFLEKEDHAYNVAVSSVMKKELHTLTETGLSVKDVENLLSNTDVKGFPIVTADGALTLAGYIDRSELRYVIERARKTRGRITNIPCLFTTHSEYDGLEIGRPNFEEEEPNEQYFAPTTAGEVQFAPWVNKTPMTVSPDLPLETVMQIFKRMGPRVILVEDKGMLCGLVTVKDVLRYIATEKPGHRPSWDERGGLDGLLEELWNWGSDLRDQMLKWGWRIIRRR